MEKKTAIPARKRLRRGGRVRYSRKIGARDSQPGTAKHQELEELNAENENRKLKRRIAAAVRARSSEDDSRNTSRNLLKFSKESMEKKRWRGGVGSTSAPTQSETLERQF